VGAISALLAQKIGKVEECVDLIRQAAPLHDVGKISVPDKILLKPGRLTPDEFDIMKTHIHVGAKILSGSSSLWLQMAEEIALTHHERWDGTGYLGLAGEAIARSGRIVAIADVFDALTHERPYKAAWAVADAVNEIRSQSGRQFDPVIVEAFLKLDHKSLI
jgi:putative two-component system response regulator